MHARPDALFVSGGFLFSSRQVQLVHLATRHGIPAAYGDREYVEVGGLMSYGTNLMEFLRQVGVYAGRILKDESRPICRCSRRRRSSCSSTSRPPRRSASLCRPSLLARADEVIE